MATSQLTRTCSVFAFVSLVSACSGAEQQANNLTGGDAERGTHQFESTAADRATRFPESLVLVLR